MKDSNERCTITKKILLLRRKFPDVELNDRSTYDKKHDPDFNYETEI